MKFVDRSIGELRRIPEPTAEQLEMDVFKSLVATLKTYEGVPDEMMLSVTEEMASLIPPPVSDLPTPTGTETQEPAAVDGTSTPTPEAAASDETSGAAPSDPSQPPAEPTQAAAGDGVGQAAAA